MLRETCNRLRHPMSNIWYLFVQCCDSLMDAVGRPSFVYPRQWCIPQDFYKLISMEGIADNLAFCGNPEAGRGDGTEQ